MHTTSTEPERTVDAILDQARWAPSGDNTQPWRFQVRGSRQAVVFGHDTREHCVYDLDGWASRLSLGALLETAALAATAHGWRMESTRRADAPESQPTFDLEFFEDAAVRPSPLLPAIPRRSVQRRPYSTTALSAAQKAELQAAAGPGLEVRWLEGSAARLRAALVLFRSARLRLVTPEAYRVHRDVIEWDARFSDDKVPDQALGVPSPMLAMMRFAMHSWERVQFFNRFLAGTWSPRLQMDLLPALACGAHFVLVARAPQHGIDDQVSGGRAMQRFWLTATHLGLSLQPELTPLIFARYARQRRPFSVLVGAQQAAGEVERGLARLAGADVAECGVFMGRIGHGPEVISRSLRRDLAALMQPEAVLAEAGSRTLDAPTRPASEQSSTAQAEAVS